MIQHTRELPDFDPDPGKPLPNLAGNLGRERLHWRNVDDLEVIASDHRR